MKPDIYGLFSFDSRRDRKQTGLFIFQALKLAPSKCYNEFLWAILRAIYTFSAGVKKKPCRQVRYIFWNMAKNKTIFTRVCLSPVFFFFFYHTYNLIKKIVLGREQKSNSWFVWWMSWQGAVIHNCLFNFAICLFWTIARLLNTFT